MQTSNGLPRQKKEHEKQGDEPPTFCTCVSSHLSSSCPLFCASQVLPAPPLKPVIGCMAIKRFILPVAPIGIMARRRGKTIKKSSKQTGKSVLEKDRKIRPDALPPGKRRSARGKIYFENRKNRSDLHGHV